MGVADCDQGLDDLDVIIEGDHGNAVIRAKALDDADRTFEGGLEGVAAHGAGTVDDQGEVKRSTLGGSGVFGDGLGRSDETDEDVRRISGGAKGESFVGTDFSYDDLAIISQVTDWDDADARASFVAAQPVAAARQLLVERLQRRLLAQRLGEARIERRELRLRLARRFLGAARERARTTRGAPARSMQLSAFDGDKTRKTRATAEEMAREAMRLASHKLPIKCQFVTRQEIAAGE